MNTNSVVTKAATQEKLPFGSPKVYPKFSILDPVVTYTLPPRQIANGIVDTFVHITEQYLTYYAGDSMLQDRLFEALLKVLVADGPKALASPTNYDVRANLMLASTWALNGWFGCGIPQDWATHSIGHELTAFYGLDHAQTLAIVLPGLLTVMREQKKAKLITLGREIFGIYTLDEEEAINQTIRSLEAFFERVGVKTHLSDYGLGDEAIEKVVARMEQRGWKLGECGNITSETIREILLLRK
jgi:NADP-dependent alcohol dehydrogenase